MRLFHTGYSIIKDIDLSHGRKNADFGQGFYLSEDEAFSRRWAKERKGETVYLNTYELSSEGLSIKVLQRDEEWISYIYENRRGIDSLSSFDVITGPVANDTLYDCLGITTSGYITNAEALELLKIGPEYRQTVIKTGKAKNRMKWLSAEEIKPEMLKEYSAVLLKEQEEFLEVFAKKFDEME